MRLVATSALLLIVVFPVWALEEPVDLDAVTKIRDEGLHRSQVMGVARHISDVIGPRVTGSPPQHREANEWTRSTLEDWGLDARLEDYEFGHGWSFQRSQVHAVLPFQQPLFALPRAWTPGTDGVVRGRAMRVSLRSPDDLEKYRGKLEGAILLLDPERTPEQIEIDHFHRYDRDGLREVRRFGIPREDEADWLAEVKVFFEFWPVLAQYLVDEGVVAMIEVSSRDNGIVRVDRGGTNGLDGFPAGVPALVMMTEHYNRLVRLVDEGIDVELEVEVAATFHHEDPMAYNTIADLPGTDLADQIVLVGAHLDSWHGGHRSHRQRRQLCRGHGGRADHQGGRPATSPDPSGSGCGAARRWATGDPAHMCPGTSPRDRSPLIPSSWLFRSP